MQKALFSVRERLSPSAIERALGRTRSIWPSKHKAASWDAFGRVLDEVVSSIETDKLRSFGAHFESAYREGVGDLHPAQGRDESARSERHELGGDVD
ncbi:hypothetical protein D3227_31915 [Mesorhizobium waimense]|uniref:Type VI secretion system FHA domain-containing protein n=1 Tax=Mesorhizobium waimense TaxID=1300307 RepID=A0A3A5KEP7_9HYPH|nr:type VI secretion system-associated FHA domain protein [Mesorhizobium waimense]RJT29461.1 hypothetical protein D3227_31915 [Mesorhizobium waimense]